jgi:hypothetical protein
MKEILEDKINLLIENLLTSRDTTGQSTEKLADGRVVDTKSWQVCSGYTKR